jgi:hypothetical protein
MIYTLNLSRLLIQLRAKRIHHNMALAQSDSKQFTRYGALEKMESFALLKLIEGKFCEKEIICSLRIAGRALIELCQEKQVI